ncbi:GAF and ANTAR domain-containing protein [Subtercola boreus]|uniref:Transcriptional regulator n=1 Tax=Subtercola boreus TaxID=120213 RepID=A0A3E0WCY8_9MICO|nr:GAF and ANTAR domain-containing protein [Subtercola boreus]RFA22844.1 transcriptional regulator [Subtercola boreus]RFA23195.1 transcriptional regulator [Subtercola boreus]RFA28788.1 transcriptional regulator [Subtercola boreus]
MNREARLAEVFITLADTLTDDFDATDLLHYLADACVELLGIDAAGIMLSDLRGGLKLAASSSERIHNLELFELQINEGPCLDCFHSGEPVLNQTISEAKDRWPRFVVVAAEAGVKSTHALPLRLRGHVIGAMNLCSDDTTLMTEPDIALGQALADMATISLLQDRSIAEKSVLADQLQAALNNRVLIEQAKGMLAARADITPDEAFDLIRAHARANNNRLLNDAQMVIDGTLELKPSGVASRPGGANL